MLSVWLIGSRISGSHLIDNLEVLRALDGEYPMDESVLRLQVAEDGSMALMAGGFASLSKIDLGSTTFLD